MEGLIRDLRFALRGLLKTPGFTAAAVLALALGIGATTAIFSVVHAVMMKSLGWGEESRLVSISDEHRGRKGSAMSPPEVFDLRQVPIFEVSGGFSGGTVALQGDRTERVTYGQVTAGFFEALGVHPAYGRTFTPEEDMKGKSNVTLISAGAWRRRYGADPSIVGRSVTLDGNPYRVIGILPEGFGYDGPRDFWITYGMTPEQLVSWRGAHWLQAVARLKPGVTPEAARKGGDEVSERSRKKYRDKYPKENAWKLSLEPIRDRFVGSMKQPLLMLF